MMKMTHTGQNIEHAQCMAVCVCLPTKSQFQSKNLRTRETENVFLNEKGAYKKGRDEKKQQQKNIPNMKTT